MELAESSKRKSEGQGQRGGGGKRAKTSGKKQWRVPRQQGAGAPGYNTSNAPKTIQPGDSGIWVTCAKGKESKCVGEMRDLFAEYAEELGWDRALPEDESKKLETPLDGDDGVRADGAEEDGLGDIESEIRAELSDIRQSRKNAAYAPIKLDVQCVVFFKTSSPVEPVSLVKRICEDAMNDRSRKRTRFAKRLSPMTLIGRASTEGLEKVALEVLKPHFHQEPFVGRKFAIRPTLRNHNILTRDSIIKLVASLVGPGHQVDLKNYELLIVVEVYQNVCGVSVIDDSFERLKRYNIAEIFEPTPREDEQ